MKETIIFAGNNISVGDGNFWDGKVEKKTIYQ